MMKTILAFLVMALFGYAVQAEPLSLTPAEEARATTLGAEFRCVVCQSQSINDSQADMARNMRLMIRDKIRDGWSDQQIFAYMRSRYGDFILLRPPFQANTFALWLGPALLVLVAGGWVFASSVRPRSRAPAKDKT